MVGHSIKQFLRGGVSTPHIVVSTWLGACLAGVVSASNSLGLLLFVLILASIVRVNWGVLAIATLVAKTAFWLGSGMVFASGQWLLTGPLAEMWMNLACLPLVAWFGLEYPVVSGALLWTLPLTLVLSVFLAFCLRWMRRGASSVEANSAYQSFVSKPIGRWVLKFILGISASEGVSAALAKNTDFWRWKGTALASALVVIAGVFGNQWVNSNAKELLSSALSTTNGATVDIEQAEFNLWHGRLNLQGLQVADSDDLDTNILTADTLSVTISWGDILRKQLHVDEVIIHQAQSGTQRARRGELMRSVIPSPDVGDIDAETVEDYLKQGKIWKERLAQIKEWLDQWESSEQATQPVPSDSGYEAWLDEQIQSSGYASIVSEALARRYWQTIVNRVYVDALEANWLESETLVLEMTSLSSAPAQTALVPRLQVTSASDNVALDVSLDALLNSGTNSSVQGYFNNIDYQAIKSQLNNSFANKVEQGIVNINLSGDFHHSAAGALDILLAAQLTNARLNIKGEQLDVERLDIPVSVQGAFANPSIRVDKSVLESQLKNLLKDAVKSKAESKLKDKVQDKLKGLFKR